METLFSLIVSRKGTVVMEAVLGQYIYQNGIFWMTAVAWIHFMGWWNWVKVYFGWVRVGGGIFGVGGGRWTFFMDGWE